MKTLAVFFPKAYSVESLGFMHIYVPLALLLGGCLHFLFCFLRSLIGLLGTGYQDIGGARDVGESPPGQEKRDTHRERCTWVNSEGQYQLSVTL